MFGLHLLDIFAILLYFGVVVFIGMMANRRIKNEEDYFMGGRKFGKLISVFLAFGTGTSSDTAISASRETYRAGMAGIWIQLLWLFITPFYWIVAPWYRRLRVITGGDYFQLRFNSKALTGLYVGFSFLSLMFAIAVAMTAIGKTVEIVTVKPVQELTVEERQSVEQYEELTQLRQSQSERTLEAREQSRLEELSALEKAGAVKARYSFLNTSVAVPVIALIILFYGVAGGLFAAAWTDSLQGILILLLSMLLLPSGLSEIGWFSGLHEKIPDHMFDLVSNATASEYTWYYILVLIVMNLVGVVAQPHFFATGGGGAKDEITARVGMVFGNFLKRFTTIMWGLTGIVALALFGDVIKDADMIWGYATRQLLGPGFVGIMIACLLAAAMSSADALMICGSALFTRNFYEYIVPGKSEKHYVLIGRLASVALIVGAVAISLYFNNILSLLKYIWQLPVIFGTVFWLSIYWRRLTVKAALTAVGYSWIMIVLLPGILPEFSWVAGHAHKEILAQPNLAMLYMVGFDLPSLSKPMLMTINYGLQVIVPFLLLFAVSLVTAPPERKRLNEVFARLHTPVCADENEDRNRVRACVNNPQLLEKDKWLPGSNWEFIRPDKKSVNGFLICIAIAFAILGFAFFISRLTFP
ncbi:MAG TPA: sodium:solute symporter family protein [Caldithrix abyssi]|uniref:Sodium:solute symporter family protein n=1 Tax=Caldithrix abyssi TaxID=187145 RepID=A0A7V1LL84_CALAY|nr:sodium:solute symporter family protein [Caldithrix abyssi]